MIQDCSYASKQLFRLLDDTKLPSSRFATGLATGAKLSEELHELIHVLHEGQHNPDIRSEFMDFLGTLLLSEVRIRVHAVFLALNPATLSRLIAAIDHGLLSITEYVRNWAEQQRSRGRHHWDSNLELSMVDFYTHVVVNLRHHWTPPSSSLSQVPASSVSTVVPLDFDQLMMRLRDVVGPDVTVTAQGDELVFSSKANPLLLDATISELFRECHHPEVDPDQTSDTF